MGLARLLKLDKLVKCSKLEKNILKCLKYLVIRTFCGTANKVLKVIKIFRSLYLFKVLTLKEEIKNENF